MIQKAIAPVHGDPDPLSITAEIRKIVRHVETKNAVTSRPVTS
jgi:hypothetical protein